MKIISSFIKKSVVVAALVVSSFVLSAGAAHADYSYEVHESRSDVRYKDMVLRGTEKACSWGVKAMYSKAGKIMAKIVCSAGNAGVAYATAAAADCKMMQDITIHTSGYSSYNRSTTLYFPYDCRGG